MLALPGRQVKVDSQLTVGRKMLVNLLQTKIYLTFVSPPQDLVEALTAGVSLMGPEICIKSISC